MDFGALDTHSAEHRVEEDGEHAVAELLREADAEEHAEGDAEGLLTETHPEEHANAEAEEEEDQEEVHSEGPADMIGEEQSRA
jgi:hypothetical protein